MTTTEQPGQSPSLPRTPIQETLHKVLFHTHSRKSRYVVRIVSYGPSPLLLEKRPLVLDLTTKKETVGRCRGLTGIELKRIIERWPEIEEIFTNNCHAYSNRGNK